MEHIKDFRGKVVQVDLKYTNGTIEKRVGIIAKQEYKTETDRVFFTMLEACGRKTTFPVSIAKLEQIKSVRLSAEERRAYQDTYKAYNKLEGFLEKYEKEKTALETEFTMKMKHLKTFSDSLTFDDFSGLINQVFYEKFYKTKGILLEYSGGSTEAATMSVSKDCGKWLDLNKFPFITQEYDGAYFVEPQYPEHDLYCKTHGPKSIPELDTLYESSYEASVGDKRSLFVSLNYRIPLKYGITRSSIRDIETQLDKAFEKNSDIDKKIKTAEKQQGKKEKKTKNTKTELIK